MPFMELGGSLLLSQKPTTGPYPEPAESTSPPQSPYLPKVPNLMVFSNA